MESEKQITNKIIKVLNAKYAETTWVYKRFATYNEIGQPDITGVHRGKRVEIEVKAPSLDRGSVEANKILASKKQRFYLDKYEKLGAITGVVCGLKQAEGLLKASELCF